MTHEPEQYATKPTRFSPNSMLPVLVYRDALPLPVNECSATDFLQRHDWIKRGTFGTVRIRHFHPNTHECYGVFEGESTLLIGVGGGDAEDEGVEVEVHSGDVVVIPAGVSHSSVKSTINYSYIGVYPKDSPHWRNELGKKPIDDGVLAEEVKNVEIPKCDPVSGEAGPLPRLWRQFYA